jgi:glutathione S-transferase
LKRRPEWYLELNPLGSVPCIQHSDGRIVYESIIICEYLDAIYPDKKLIPSDPYERARQLMLVEAFQRVVALLFKSMKFKDPEAFNEILKVLDTYEKTLPNVDEFFAG